MILTAHGGFLSMGSLRLHECGLAIQVHITLLAMVQYHSYAFHRSVLSKEFVPNPADIRDALS